MTYINACCIFKTLEIANIVSNAGSLMMVGMSNSDEKIVQKQSFPLLPILTLHHCPRCKPVSGLPCNMHCFDDATPVWPWKANKAIRLQRQQQVGQMVTLQPQREWVSHRRGKKTKHFIDFLKLNGQPKPFSSWWGLEKKGCPIMF